MPIARTRVAALVVTSAAVLIFPAAAHGAPPPPNPITVQLGVTGTPRFAHAAVMQPGEVREVSEIVPSSPLPNPLPPLAGTHSHIEDKFYRPGATTQLGATDPEAALAVVQARVGQQVTFDVDGGHQVAVYKVPDGWSFDDAYAHLDGLVVDGTMTVGLNGIDQTVLSDEDKRAGFVYLGTASVRNARTTLLVSNGSWTSTAPGKYVALCNVSGHYKAWDMRARIQVH